MFADCNLRLFAAACLLVGLVAPEEKTSQVIKGWGRVIDPDGDCKVAEEGGTLTITIPGTHHDLNPTPAFDNLKAPRVLQEVEGDFVMQVKALPFAKPEANTSSNARHSYVGAGLLVWQDGNNFFRLLRAANGESGFLFVSAELYHDGKFVGGRDVETAEQPTYLQVERLEGRFRILREFRWPDLDPSPDT